MLDEQKKYDDEKFWHHSVVLNTEFMIAADFIFDGLINLINVTYFQSYSESKLFTSYYKLAVGVERVQKIILKLAYDYIGDEDKAEFDKQIEKAFFGHNHEHLNWLLGQYTGTENNFGKQENLLISQMLHFYSDFRYGKYKIEATEADMYRFHVGEEFSPGYNPKFYTRIGEIFGSIEKILSWYLQVLDNLQNNIVNYLGECGTDAKLYVIVNYSKVLKKYFKLFILAKLEYRDKDADFKPIVTPTEKFLADIDVYFGGNGINVIYSLFEYYYRVEEERGFQDFDSPLPMNHLDKKSHKQKIKELDKIICFYEERNPNISQFGF